MNAGITGEISHIDCGQTWFVIRRRSPIVRYAKSSPREVRKQGPDSAARFPYCGNLLRRRCPGSRKHGPTPSGLHPHVRFTKDGGGRSS